VSEGQIDKKWFFSFRQNVPGPAGALIAQGPFDTYEQAMAELEKALASNAEVSTPFSATTQVEAQEMIETDRSL
jgi:hypothetical protein